MQILFPSLGPMLSSQFNLGQSHRKYQMLYLSHKLEKSMSLLSVSIIMSVVLSKVLFCLVSHMVFVCAEFWLMIKRLLGLYTH